jgi:hypothetical protein
MLRLRRGRWNFAVIAVGLRFIKMSRGAQSFKQGDVTKAIKGAFNAGLAVTRVKIDKKTGDIIVFADHTDAPLGTDATSDWDDVQ